jgi:hypothetical protein
MSLAASAHGCGRFTSCRLDILRHLSRLLHTVLAASRRLLAQLVHTLVTTLPQPLRLRLSAHMRLSISDACFLLGTLRQQVQHVLRLIFFSIERPPSSHSGTSSWSCHSGASFHMTNDSSALSSVHPIDSLISVLTDDGSSLVEALLAV